MKKSFEKIELLSPARDKVCAFAAIDAGADAVYIGAEAFGARRAAGNSIEDIKEIVDYAHIFRAKVYVAVNTVLYSNEIQKAVELICKLKNIGVDAIIIQDMGLLECGLPDIALHLSTQGHNSTLEKVKFVEKTGLSRIVLARELSLDEIKNISDNTDIELECFIHGALCVSYSGQCYLSYALGGRSANRGECAQPCRDKYSLVDKNGVVIADKQHLLCLKDFNASSSLEEMVLAGVSSFKIEGRLKDENYVKNVVSFYRRELDKIINKHRIQKSSLGNLYSDFESDLKKTFNRGYCEYFLGKRKNDISEFRTSKQIGEKIGKVEAIKENAILLKNHGLANADGLSFFSKNGEHKGTKVEKVNGDWAVLNSVDGISLGTTIFRNYSHEFVKELERADFKRKIPVKIDFEVGEKIKISISDVENVSNVIEIENDFEVAQNKDKAIETIKKQLSKLGDTEFELNKIVINCQTAPFIPVQQLNEFRRTLVEKLREKRKLDYASPRLKKIETIPFYTTELDYSHNVTNEKAKEFYEKRGAKVCEMGLEVLAKENIKGKKLMTTKHCLRYSFNLCPQNGKKVEELFLKDKKGKLYPLKFDCKNCVMEIYAP